ncbi:MAG: hypothetical protein J0J01_26645 [Reyranella sp.]|uniref:hypothetical protein n=1 Tax=Reyranella sp. TaxID=1929291 RepID=UPI001AD3EAF6|nr:hypothetical protein [Reyranella sp.]MBN9090506.1 hypothetical protein [Reyranella sp.]
MTLLKKIAAVAAALLPVAAFAATIGSVDYATQYDYREFFNAADGKPFRVVLAGTPFPGATVDSAAGPLLAQMQAAKPQPRLTFTYDVPSERPRPDYRLVLVFDAAGDFGAPSVCAGATPRLRTGTPSRVNVFAVYCRNDQALSQATAWTAATGPDDPRLGELFRELFPVLFSDAMGLRPQTGGNMR